MDWKFLNHVQKVTLKKKLRLEQKYHFIKNVNLITIYCKWSVTENSVTVLLLRGCRDRETRKLSGWKPV